MRKEDKVRLLDLHIILTFKIQDKIAIFWSYKYIDIKKERRRETKSKTKIKREKHRIKGSGGIWTKNVGESNRFVIYNFF